MASRMLAETTHVVAAQFGFACKVIAATQLYTEIRAGILEPRGVEIWPFLLIWLLTFTTACAAVQAPRSLYELSR